MFSSLMFSGIDLTGFEPTYSDVYLFSILILFLFLLSTEVRHLRSRYSVQVVRQSYLTNISTFLFNDTLMSILSISSLLFIAENSASFGLLSALTNPFLKGVLSFLLLDLTLYLWHRACHSFDWLWMLHKVHHSDLCMNVSTAFRLHFVEVLLTTLVKIVFVLVTGVDVALVLTSEMVITLFTLFHHSNLPLRGEVWIGRLLIVPYLHRIHHSARRDEHDHNYGAVFSIWDRLFRTFVELEPAQIGLRGVQALGVWQLMKFGLTYQLEEPSPETVNAMIAKAAYYKAEKRGFASGWELVDWLEAEREIKQGYGGFWRFNATKVKFQPTISSKIELGCIEAVESREKVLL